MTRSNVRSHVPSRCGPTSLQAWTPAIAGDDWYALGDEAVIPLQDFDVIMMRKDPPFDMEYVYATYFLERAEAAGVLVVNRPQSLRDCNEKFFATSFPSCCPPLVVSRRMDVLRDFYAQHGNVVFKKLDGMGGMNVFRVMQGDANLGVILETLTGGGSEQIMGQKYLPEISDGDKRILMIDGEPVPYALARIPAQGEARGNLAAGGTGEGRAVDGARSRNRHHRRTRARRARSAFCRPGRDRRLSDRGERDLPHMYS